MIITEYKDMTTQRLWRFFSLFLLLLAAVAMQAQDLTVRSFGMAQGDIDARSSTTQRTDRNGTPCALVKVQLPLQGAVFDGVVGDVQFRAGVYWVYMPDGGYQLKISHPQFHVLDLNLRTLRPAEENFRGVEQLTTYNLIINVPQTGQIQTDDGKQYLMMSVTPEHSKVYIDGNERGLTNGQLSVRLPKGSHHYRVEANGYATSEGDVTLGNERGAPIKVTLQSVMSTLSVSCETPGAKIYINDLLKGNAPWQGQVEKGEHIVEARCEGYHPRQQSIEIDWNDSKKVTLPALQAIVGQLDVNFLPLEAEVYIDGKRLGTSPNVFRNIAVGTHRVELRKDGYQSETKQITISEGQTAQLNGQLQQAQASTPATSGPVTETDDALTFTVGGVQFKMIRVEGGTFTMGATSEQGSDAYSVEKPAHRVKPAPTTWARPR